MTSGRWSLRQRDWRHYGRSGLSCNPKLLLSMSAFNFQDILGKAMARQRHAEID